MSIDCLVCKRLIRSSRDNVTTVTTTCDCDLSFTESDGRLAPAFLCTIWIWRVPKGEDKQQRWKRLFSQVPMALSSSQQPLTSIRRIDDETNDTQPIGSSSNNVSKKTFPQRQHYPYDVVERDVGPTAIVVPTIIGK